MSRTMQLKKQYSRTTLKSMVVWTSLYLTLVSMKEVRDGCFAFALVYMTFGCDWSEMWTRASRLQVTLWTQTGLAGRLR